MNLERMDVPRDQAMFAPSRAMRLGSRTREEFGSSEDAPEAVEASAAGVGSLKSGEDVVDTPDASRTSSQPKMVARSVAHAVGYRP